MDGILLVDKPKGPTSFDIVHKVRKIIESAGLNNTGRKRFPVGHTGTLDPLASGLLVLVLGSYTKRAQEFSKLDKTYEVEMKLGQISSTGDEEGVKTAVSSKRPAASALKKAMELFEGEIEQTPPAYSAIKINGQRAYKLARQGKEVELKPRPVTINNITDMIYKYPEVTFTASVSSGTYIRSLVEDIGKILQTGAYMTELRRTEVGDYPVSSSLKLEEASAAAIEHSIIDM